MANEKRLTWKRSLDGHTDVGLREGVSVGEAICKLADLEEMDAVEVVHGRWIPINTIHKLRFQCDQCKHYVDAGTDRNYCPNCGAKMDLK